MRNRAPGGEFRAPDGIRGGDRRRLGGKKLLLTGRAEGSAATATAGRMSSIIHTSPNHAKTGQARRTSPGAGPPRYCGRSAIQMAVASLVPGFRQVCGWSPRK